MLVSAPTLLLAPILLVVGDGGLLGFDDANCCAYRMLIIGCVTSQPKACDPWLQKLIDIGSWATSENLFTKCQDLSSLLLSTSLLVRSLSCVSSLVVSCEKPTLLV